jgi:sulfonate transport system ATP-binding protein
MMVSAAASTTELAVRLRSLSRRFGDRTVLDSIDLDIPAGQFVALLGKSGSGKTTLLRLLSGLDDGAAGTILVPERRTTVFQEPRLVPSKRVWKNVVLGLHARANRARALATLDEVGLADKSTGWPALLSGGEAQRVALARALIREPQLLLLDEPFAALDALTRVSMQTLVRRLCTVHGPATLLVTHDVDEAIQLADRILVLRDGRLIYDQLVAANTDRQRGTAGFNDLRTELLTHLGHSQDGAAAEPTDDRQNTERTA